MGDLVLKGSTSGQITVTPTAVAGTNTLTLPAKTGNIITSADSGTVTQTMLGTNVAGNGPAFSAYISVATSMGNSTYTVLGYNTKNFDTATCYNNTGSTATLNGLSVPAYSFCPNVAGYYQFNAGTNNGSGTTAGTNNNIALYRNGTQMTTGSNATASSAMYWATSGIIYLNGTGDYVNVQIYQNGGGAINTGAFSGCSFQGALIRSA